MPDLGQSERRSDMGLSGWSNPIGGSNYNIPPPLGTRVPLALDEKVCVLCGGTGQVRIVAPFHTADEFCWTCNGTGRIKKDV